MVHAFDVTFSDIQVEADYFVIDDIVSDTGLSYGISAWYNSTLTFGEDVDVAISNIKAGNKYLEDDLEVNMERYTAANHQPQACAFRVHDNAQYPVSVEFEGDDSVLTMQCVFGMNGCGEQLDGVHVPYTHVGAVNNRQCEVEGQYLSAANMKGEEVDLEGLAAEEALIEQIGYLGNVLIVFIISVLVIGVAAVYYCCLQDDKRQAREPDRFTRTLPVDVGATPYGTL